MARQLNSALWNEWRQRLKRQRASGLSISEFCRRENLSSHTFHCWRRKLRPAARGPSRIQPVRQVRGVLVKRQGGASSSASPRPAGFLQLPLAPAPQSPWIELSLADGTLVRVPQQNIAAALAVLRELRGESWNAALAERDDA
jgi:hypothetical protein